MARKKRQRLSDIDIEEVSLVDKPATGRPFFFAKSADGQVELIELDKADTSILITSDGTAGGTKVNINGAEVKEILNFAFGYWAGASDGPEVADMPVNCSYTVAAKGKSKGGFRSTRTYILAKATGEAAEVNKAAAVNVNFTSDGTRKGTKLSIDGQEYEDVWSSYVNFGPKWDMGKQQESKTKVQTNIGWTTMEEMTNGTRRTTTRNVTKTDKADESDIKKIQEFLGDEVELDGNISQQAGTALAGTLDILSEYQDIFPKEVGKAINELAFVAVAKADEEAVAEPSKAVAKKEKEETVSEEQETKKPDDETKTEEKKPEKETPVDVSAVTAAVIADMIGRNILQVVGAKPEVSDAAKPADEKKPAASDATAEVSDTSDAADDEKLEYTPEELAQMDADIAAGKDTDL